MLLDYDGTLRAYVSDPRDATPGPRLLSMLARLSQLATVYVVSGRSKDELDRWLGHLSVGLVSEHGLRLRAPGEAWQLRVRVKGPALKKLVLPLFEEFVGRTPGSRVELKEAAIAWHYLLDGHPYAMLHGNRVIEVRHKNVNKGHALRHILERHRATDFVFCAGDDRTDEDMMSAIPARLRSRSVTCWVGGRNAHARYWVESNVALHDVLDRLTRLLERPRKT